MQNVSNIIPGKIIIAADFTLSRLLSLNLLKTSVEINPKAGIRRMTWYEKWTLGRMIQSNTASPYTNAEAKLRKLGKDKYLL